MLIETPMSECGPLEKLRAACRSRICLCHPIQEIAFFRGSPFAFCLSRPHTTSKVSHFLKLVEAPHWRYELLTNSNDALLFRVKVVSAKLGGLAAADGSRFDAGSVRGEPASPRALLALWVREEGGEDRHDEFISCRRNNPGPSWKVEIRMGELICPSIVVTLHA